MLNRRLLTALAAMAVAFIPGATLVALADEPLPTAIPSYRPPAGVLRHVDAPTASAAATAVTAPRSTKELVIFVGGYQTCPCELAEHGGRGFGDYAERATAAGYDVVYFGQDARFPYDSYGHVAPSGQSLRDQIRSLSERYAAIHVVAHSMGGVIVDQAFAQGLSAADGVATYVALSSPHSGSDAARGIRIVNSIGDGESLHQVASLGGRGFETRSDAVDDLASATAVPAPAAVVRLDVRESTDVLVTERDARDPGVPSRVLQGSIEGHGGILSDRSAIDLTFRTIATRRVPPDERSARLVRATEAESRVVGALALAGICLLTVYFCLRRIRPKSPLDAFERDALPPARRRSFG